MQVGPEEIARIEDIVARYLLEPETFWDGSTHFHERNITKLKRVVATHRIDRDKIVKTLVPRLLERSKREAKSLFVVSCGSSGCHFLGSKLALLPDFQLVGEVYFPPRLLELADKEANSAVRHALLDMVSWSHIVDGVHLSAGAIPVNVMHLRKDGAIDQLHDHLPGARVVRLLRNPMHIAVSRAFRKQKYRQTANPGIEDRDYLTMQSRNVRNFFRRSEKVDFDATVRFEDALGDSDRVIATMLGDFGWGRHHTRFRPGEAEAHQIDNHNAARKEQLSPEYSAILREQLLELNIDYGYTVPENVDPGRLEEDERLWTPERDQFVSAAATGLLEQKREIWVAKGHRTFPVDVDLMEAFEAQADAPLSWQMYFFCFSWLYALEGRKSDPPQRDFFRKVGEMRDLLARYAEVPANEAPRAIWDDHATAFRTAVLVYVIRRYRHYAVVAHHIEKWQQIVERHLEVLETFVADDKWLGTNHGIFHALAYLNCLLHLGGEIVSASEEAIARAEERLLLVSASLIDTETGITLERSLHYQVWTIPLFDTVLTFLEKNKRPIPEPLLVTVDRMVAFLDYVCVGELSLPAIGDTPSLNSYRRQGIDDRLTALRSDALRGRFENERSIELDPKYSTKAGIAAVRTLQAGNEAGGDDSLLLFTFPDERGAHGHYDGLAVNLILKGRHVLIDSGGPYLYGDKKRYQYFVQNLAHNGVVVDGKPYEGACENFSIESAGESVRLSACIADNHGVSHRRTVHVLAAARYLLVDELVALDEKVHELELLFHLPPGLTGSIDEKSGRATIVEVEGGAEVARIGWTAEASLSYHRNDPGGDAKPVAWHTPRQGVMEPIEMLACKARLERRSTIVTAFGSAGADLPAVEFGDGEIFVTNAGEKFVHRLEG